MAEDGLLRASALLQDADDVLLERRVARLLSWLLLQLRVGRLRHHGRTDGRYPVVAIVAMTLAMKMA